MTRSTLTPIVAALLALPLPLLQAGCEGCNDSGEETPTPAVEATPAPQYDRGYYLSMALDSAGRPWLAFQDRDGEEEGDAPLLSVARGSGDPAEFTTWQVDGAPDRTGPIPSGGFDGGFYATIAVDDADVPHVAHWDKSGDNLRYAVRSGDSWTAETVESGAGEFADIAITADGAPIIAYYNRAGGALRVAVRSDTGWTTEEVDAGTAPEGAEADVGLYADVFVDASGDVHIAYLDLANGDLKVASGGPGNWSTATWYAEGDVGAWPTLSEHQGDLFVAFEDMGNQDLLWGRWDGAELSVTSIDESDFVGPDAAVVWSDGEPVVMYHDGMNNDALLAVRSGDVWTLSVHMSNGAVGFHNNLALDDADRVAWATFNHTSTDFVFQRFEIAAGDAR